MNVLLVVPGGVTADGRGDVIPVLFDLVCELSSRCTVVVVSVDHRPEPLVTRTQNFLLINSGRSRLPSLAGAYGDSRRIRRLLIANSVSFEILHSFWFGLPSTMAYLLSRAQGTSWVASLGGQELSRRRLEALPASARFLQRCANALVMRKADAITGGSRLVLAEMAAYGRDAAWLPLFPNVRPPVAEHGIDRSNRHNRLRIVTIADHNETKDPETLLRVISLLTNRGRQVSLDWIGREIQPGRARALAAELGIADRVFIHGHLSYELIADRLSSADLYLQSSRYESQGVAVCEAATLGLPIVGTNTGIVADLAPHSAIAAEVGDAMALANAVEQLIDDRELRVEMGRRAARWMSSYSIRWTVSRMVDLYENLLRGQARERD